MKYISFYDRIANSQQNRKYVLSATTKINYICNAINQSGNTVQIVSPSWTKNTKGFYKGLEYFLYENTQVKLFSTFGASNKITKSLRYLWSVLSLLLFLLSHTQKDEPVLVYHSLALIHPIRLAKFFKKFRLILEVEEIYSDVSGSLNQKKNECKFFDCADAYIFSTELLNEKLNQQNKPFISSYGTYCTEENRGSSFDDQKIHCVYAGTFDPLKGGCGSAIAAAEYLDGRYHLHILGFGTEQQKETVLNLIDSISKKSKCKVTFDGLLSGDDYIKFIQSCHIGLSTQNPNASYNDTSFPSKVLSYLSNGLRVVSIRIKALERSSISDLLYYYDEDTAESIATTIKSVNLTDHYDSRARINKLDCQFCKKINKLMES